MIQEAMRIAANSGCYKLALSSNLKRADAHRFYQSLGFHQHGISFAIDPSQNAGEARQTESSPVCQSRELSRTVLAD
jgi:hypothetical protein